MSEGKGTSRRGRGREGCAGTARSAQGSTCSRAHPTQPPRTSNAAAFAKTQLPNQIIGGDVVDEEVCTHVGGKRRTGDQAGMPGPAGMLRGAVE